MDKTTIYNLNSVLFEAVKRINNPDLSGQALQDEKTKANALKGLGGVMAKIFSLELDASLKTKDLPENRSVLNESLPDGFKK